MLRITTAAVVLLAAGAYCGSAHAAGYWNVPSTPYQFVGTGFGPGHHAPMMIGPRWKNSVASPGVRRLPSTPSNPPIVWGMSCLGCQQEGPVQAWPGEPIPPMAPPIATMGAPIAAPMAAPTVAPEPQLFEPPSPSHDRTQGQLPVPPTNPPAGQKSAPPSGPANW
ncbi:hypothetical protein [Aeoliella mucimassa]|uniref:IgA FC receptor n=1 Tax=Aeoliella mucimassa TaxID=2527972 RepID=A0A518ALL6_9BACT|nr:hypothetical protein [Aeoliella mucimassa]QDU55623.1 hypothetical protein Pan181_18160 [Aeoliella mucimassa]